MTVSTYLRPLLPTLTAAALLAAAPAALAEDKPGWSGKAGFGYLGTTGNSETTNVNAVLDLMFNQHKWRHSLRVGAIGADTAGVSSAERYTFDVKSKYDFTEFDYAFGLVGWQKDKFGGVEEQLTGAVGYGRRLLNNDRHILNAEAGLGYRRLDFSDGTSDSGAVMRLGGDYRFNFSETAYFTQELGVEIGADSTTTLSVSAVSAKLLEALNLVLSYTIKNNSDVPAGTEKTDTFTAINIEYPF